MKLLQKLGHSSGFSTPSSPVPKAAPRSLPLALASLTQAIGMTPAAAAPRHQLQPHAQGSHRTKQAQPHKHTLGWPGSSSSPTAHSYRSSPCIRASLFPVPHRKAAPNAQQTLPPFIQSASSERAPAVPNFLLCGRLGNRPSRANYCVMAVPRTLSDMNQHLSRNRPNCQAANNPVQAVSLRHLHSISPHHIT
jgi:hypothetical protein